MGAVADSLHGTPSSRMGFQRQHPTVPAAGTESGPALDAPVGEAATDAAPAAAPVPAGTGLPPGMYFMPLPSTRLHDWWTTRCGRCTGGMYTVLPGEWNDKGDASRAAHDHYDEAHRPADEQLTTEEIAEVERWPLSAAQRAVLSWAEHADLREFDDGFWALDCVPDRRDVNKKVSRTRVTGLWAAGLLDVRLDSAGRRYLVRSPTGRRVARLLWSSRARCIANDFPIFSGADRLAGCAGDRHRVRRTGVPGSQRGGRRPPERRRHR